MNEFRALFLRDVKKIGAIYGGVLTGFLTMSASILFLFNSSANARLGFSDFCLLLLFISHPILLSLSFTDESRVKSDHQWFALPIRRSSVVFQRFFVILLFLVVSAVASFLWSLLMVPVAIEQMEESVRSSGVNDYARLIPYYNDFWGFLFYESRYFFFTKLFTLCSFVLLGIVVFTQSLRYSVKRYNGFLMNLSVLILFIMFCWLDFDGRHFANSELEVGSIMRGIVLCVVFLAAGLYLFDRTAEV